jgi:hypothetical protein
MLAFGIPLETRGTKSSNMLPLGKEASPGEHQCVIKAAGLAQRGDKHFFGGGTAPQPKEIQGRPKALLARGAFAQSFDKGSQSARHVPPVPLQYKTLGLYEVFQKTKEHPAQALGITTPVLMRLAPQALLHTFATLLMRLAP